MWANLCFSSKLNPFVLSKAKGKISRMKGMSSLPLMVFLVVLLSVSLPGSTADPVGSCPAVDGQYPIYLTDSVRCEYVIVYI
jgi:hypothetical protein